MKAARVTNWGSPPEYIEVAELPPPSPTQLRLKVVAAGVARAVQGRAARKHPSAFEASLPFDPSIDGVGQDVATGELYFVNSLAAPLFAEFANVERDQLVKLSADADPVTIAALANPVASSWLALRCRAVGGCEGRTVVILGATSISGRCAALVARFLGAARVVGIARNESTLAEVQGLDDRVVLTDPFVMPKSVGPVHIVLDYVGGPATIQLLQTAEVEHRDNLQYIQVGGLSGSDTHALPARLINTRPIRIMGSGVGSLSMDDLHRELPGLVGAITKINTTPVGVFSAKLADVGSVWESEDAKSKRLVLVP